MGWKSGSTDSRGSFVAGIMMAVIATVRRVCGKQQPGGQKIINAVSRKAAKSQSRTEKLGFLVYPKKAHRAYLGVLAA